MESLPRLIPLFPLPNIVLFPDMPMPLHVFEQRYRKMVADVMGSHRIIGMVLLRGKRQTDARGRPTIYEVGCAGRLERCEPLEDGRYNIVLRGTTRFRVRAEHDGEPYRLASIDPLRDDLGEEQGLQAARERLATAAKERLEDAASLAARPDLPHGLFVNALCQSLPLAPIERQSLLDCDTLLARGARLIELLEFKRLEQVSGRRASGAFH